MKNFYLLFLLFTNLAFAQNKASIEGKITDASGYLPGVNLMVKNTTKGTSTDLDGTFRIENLSIGKCDLIVSFVGYAPKTVSLNLVSGSNNIGTINLSEIDQSLQEVVVKAAMAPSQMKAMSIKKNALAIMEVIAADAIGKLPDRNAAEAVQRMQGVSVARYHG